MTFEARFHSFVRDLTTPFAVSGGVFATISPLPLFRRKTLRQNRGSYFEVACTTSVT